MMKLIELISNSKPRSTVLRPFYWVMIIFFSLICICIYNKADWWILLVPQELEAVANILL